MENDATETTLRLREEIIWKVIYARRNTNLTRRSSYWFSCVRSWYLSGRRVIIGRFSGIRFISVLIFFLISIRSLIVNFFSSRSSRCSCWFDSCFLIITKKDYMFLDNLRSFECKERLLSELLLLELIFRPLELVWLFTMTSKYKRETKSTYFVDLILY